MRGMKIETCREMLIDNCEPRVGRWVRPDGWAYGSQLQPSTWGEAEFYLPVNSDGPIRELAANVTVTGRTIQADYGCSAVRVRIEFVGDCEPSTYCYGWMHVNH